MADGAPTFVNAITIIFAVYTELIQAIGTTQDRVGHFLKIAF